MDGATAGLSLSCRKNAYFRHDQFPVPQSKLEWIPYGVGTAMGMAGTAAKVGGWALRGGCNLGKRAWQVTKSLPGLEKTMKVVSKAFNYFRKSSAVQKTAKGAGKTTEVVSREGAANGKRVLRQRFTPNPSAEGGHSVFRRDPMNGTTGKYQTYWKQSNPRNPNPWEKGIRYDGNYHPHYEINKITGGRVNTPHVHDPFTPGSVRSPYKFEVP